MPETMDREGEVLCELVERVGGSPVQMDTEMCFSWKLEHGNCKGCPSEVACRKMVKLRLLHLTALMYQPGSFEDFQKMHHRIGELQDEILHAQTVKEVMQVPDI